MRWSTYFDQKLNWWSEGEGVERGFVVVVARRRRRRRKFARLALAAVAAGVGAHVTGIAVHT